MKKEKKLNNKNNQSGGAYSRWILGSLLQEKAWFLISVFAVLIFQCFVTYLTMNADLENAPKLIKSMWFIIILQIIIILLLSFVPMPPFLKFILFTVFAILVGISLQAISKKVSKEILKTAIIGTASVFIFFAIVGAILAGFSINLTWLWGILIMALLILIIIKIVFTFMPKSSTVDKLLAGSSIILFAIFIAFDTNQILQRDYSGDVVTASLDYFLDILNIFLNFVKLLSGSNE